MRGRWSYGGSEHRPETIAPRVTFHDEVAQQIQREIEQFPRVEVGGKLVGTIKAPVLPEGGSLSRYLANLEIDVIHYLDAGPRARRSPTFHLPDAAYQVALFQRLEEQHPEVQHLGTWHSHHPNGLDCLSEGDVEGYFHSVNSSDHSLDVFLASLMVDRSGLAHARHFLFVRGYREYFEIDPRAVRRVRGRNPYSAIIQGYRASFGGASRARGAESWFDSEAGKEVLRRDREEIPRLLPGARCVLKKQSGELFWEGRLSLATIDNHIIYRYPAEFPAEQPVAVVTGSGEGLQIELRVSLDADRSLRQLAHLLKLFRHLDRLRVAQGAAGPGPGRPPDPESNPAEPRPEEAPPAEDDVAEPSWSLAQTIESLRLLFGFSQNR